MGRRSRSKSPSYNRRRERDRDTNKDRDIPVRDRERDRERHGAGGRRKRSKDRSRDRDLLLSSSRRRRSPLSLDRDSSRDGHSLRRSRFSRSRSPLSPRSRSRSPLDSTAGGSGKKSKAPSDRPPVVTAADLEGKSPDEQEMMKLMGFCNFDTTKGKKVEGNDIGGVHVILKRKYRQYMNRKGGFNRPLDFVA